jgi:hypothetical protein
MYNGGIITGLNTIIIAAGNFFNGLESKYIYKQKPKKGGK